MAAQYLTPVDLERRWSQTSKISRKTLANWRSNREGQGPDFRKFGHRVRYALSDVEHYERTGEDRSPYGGYASQQRSATPPEPAPLRRRSDAIGAVGDDLGHAILSAMQAEMRALDLRRARVAIHYRSQLERIIGRRALKREREGATP